MGAKNLINFFSFYQQEPQVAPLSSPNQASNGMVNGNHRVSLSPGYAQQSQQQQQQQQQQPQLPSPTSPTSPGVFNYNQNMSHQQSLHMYQSTFQQPPMSADHTQLHHHNPNNFLNANMQNTQGGSLPDLTAFHLQNNNTNQPQQQQQHLQLPEYNNQRQHHQQHQQSPQYDLLLVSSCNVL